MRICLIFSRGILSGLVEPATAQEIRHARYSSSLEKPLLQDLHEGTTGSCSGYGSSRNTRDGQWSLVSGVPPQKVHHASVRSSANTLIYFIVLYLVMSATKCCSCSNQALCQFWTIRKNQCDYCPWSSSYFFSPQHFFTGYFSPLSLILFSTASDKSILAPWAMYMR